MNNTLRNIFSPAFRPHFNANVSSNLDSAPYLQILPELNPADSYPIRPSSEFLRAAYIPGRLKTETNSAFTADELTKMVSKAIDSCNPRGAGANALVFNVFGHPSYVLRINNKTFEKLDSGAMQLDNPVVVPAKYTDNILSNMNLGLPLYSVINADEKQKTAKGFITPTEAADSKITLLRNMMGKSPSEPYIVKLGEFTGMFDSREKKNFFALKCAYDKEDFMLKCQQGDNFRVSFPEKFYQHYVEFKEKYLDTLKTIAEMPKESYQKAINLIEDDNGIFFDFSHPNNILIDFDKKQFNFVDLAFKDSPFLLKNTKESFKNALLGNFCLDKTIPSRLLVFPEEKEIFKQLSSLIAKKCGC